VGENVREETGRVSLPHGGRKGGARGTGFSVGKIRRGGALMTES